MKTTKILSLLCIILLISSCKQNDWLDWKAQNELWLIQNAQQEGVITTPTGLQYKCIEPGFPSYARPDDAKMVTISYAGKLINGYEFDANENYTGYVSSFVPGFSEGLKKNGAIRYVRVVYPIRFGLWRRWSWHRRHKQPYSSLLYADFQSGIA